MQHSGTLRKRSRRTLVKVNGLGTKPYSQDDDDLLDISEVWSFQRFFQKADPDAQVNLAVQKFKNGLSHPKVPHSGVMYSNSNRVTRQPIFPDDKNTVDIEVGGYVPLAPNHDRPYLFCKASIRRIRTITFLGMLCLNAPWQWNRKTHKIDRWSPFMVWIWKLYWHFTTIQSIFMLIYHLHGLRGVYSRHLQSYREVFAYSLIVYWYACHLGYKMCIFMYGEQMRKYVNLLLDFNQEYVEKYLVYADKDADFASDQLIIKFSIPAAASQIANSLFFFLAMPYQPYYLTSLITSQPWYALIPGAIQDLTVIGQTILTYITISWIQVAHTASVEFWLREMHKGSDTLYTRDSIRTIQVTIPAYRSLQLLCADFNDCMSQLCLPVWKFSVAFGFIFCGFLWIRSMNKLFAQEFPGILVYPFGTVNCFTMGFGCLTMAAEMYDIANSFINSWSRTKQKDFRRVLLSCPTLKVKVDRYYFITASTTIKFFQVTTGYIIDCLLTFP